MTIERLSYAEIRQRHDLLSASFGAGTLTEAMLDTAVGGEVEDPGDGPPESIGFDWIRRNPDAFAAVVADQPEFMRRHIDKYCFSAYTIVVPEMFARVSKVERAAYLQYVLLAHGSLSTSWVKVALDHGVTRAELAEIILDKLKATVPVRGSANFIDYLFLDHGAGDLSYGDLPDKGTLWSVLDDGQFMEALRICAAKSPHATLNAHYAIGLRLDAKRWKEIAALALQGVDRMVSPRALLALPHADQVAFLRRLKPFDGSEQGAEPAFRFALGVLNGFVDEREASWLCEDLKPIFENASAAVLYRTARACAIGNPGPDVKDPRPDRAGPLGDVLKWLERELLPKQGYESGIIERGSRFDRRRREQVPQMQVRCSDRLYVQSRDQHRYIAQAGDRVLFRPASGRELTPRVKAVHFIPFHPACDY